MITVKRFTASYCMPCRALTPVLKQLETELPDVQFEIIDVEIDETQTTQFNIRTVPTVIILDNGVIKHTIVGANPKKTYLDAITSL